ncbi:hypothetical protein FRB96_002637 [Tulasnella sp. 330]|nr:hypothetical protein FRB96_002637 [Tulasnella sp. 330]
MLSLRLGLKVPAGSPSLRPGMPRGSSSPLATSSLRLAKTRTNTSNIGSNAFNAEYHEERVREVDGEDEPDADEERTFRLVGPTTERATPQAMPFSLINISLGSSINEGYAEDGVAIEIDASEVDANNFNGDAMSRSFSAKGHSGSVIVDGLGRIGGVLTSGAGAAFDPGIQFPPREHAS